MKMGLFAALSIAGLLVVGGPAYTAAAASDPVVGTAQGSGQGALVSRDKAPPKKTVAQGHITKRSKKTLVLKLGDGPSPAVGSKVELLKHFNAGFMRGWLSIATVEVKKVKGAKVKVTIVKEKSVAKVNGKKVNHFKKGNKIKLTW